jgi:hypothetical protein
VGESCEKAVAHVGLCEIVAGCQSGGCEGKDGRENSGLHCEWRVAGKDRYGTKVGRANEGVMMSSWAAGKGAQAVRKTRVGGYDDAEDGKNEI